MSQKEYERLEERLVTLYNSMEGLEEQTADGIPLPANILLKLDAYRDVLEVLGDLYGKSVGQVEYYDFLVEETEADAFLELEEKKEGTVEYRRKKARKAKGEAHKMKAVWKGVAKKWEHRYKTTQEIINILKWKMRDIHHQNEGGQ